MSDDNLYAPPESDVEVSTGAENELAGRGARLGGAIIDTLLILVVVWPIMFLTDYVARAATDTLEPMDYVIATLPGFVMFFVFHGYLLATRGQTVGKMLVKTRIVSVEDGKILPFGRLIGLRYIPIWVASLIPVIGSLLAMIDALFIFRADRRCVHDLIAGTKVIRA